MTSPGRKNDNGIAMMSSSAATSDCLISWRGAIAPRPGAVLWAASLIIFRRLFVGELKMSGAREEEGEAEAAAPRVCVLEGEEQKQKANKSITS